MKIIFTKKNSLLNIILGDYESYEQLLKEVIDKEHVEQHGENGVTKTVGYKIPFVAPENPAEKKCAEHEESKNRTIQVLNIPLEIEWKKIEGVFSKYGKIVD